MYGGYFGQPCTLSYLFYYSLYCKFNLILGANRAVVVVVVDDEPVTTEGEELGEVEYFNHLGSVKDKSGGIDADVKTRIGMVRSAFNMLKWSGALGKSGHPSR